MKQIEHANPEAAKRFNIIFNQHIDTLYSPYYIKTFSFLIFNVSETSSQNKLCFYHDDNYQFGR